MSRAYSTAVINGSSENSDIHEAMCMAEWMLYTGRTSDDWYNLPTRDVNLLKLHIISRRWGRKKDLEDLIRGVFGGKGKSD